MVGHGKGGHIAQVPLLEEGLAAARDFIAVNAFAVKVLCGKDTPILTRPAGSQKERRFTRCAATFGLWRLPHVASTAEPCRERGYSTALSCLRGWPRKARP